MLEKEILIINKLGLHARASAKLVSTASRFKSHIELSRGSKTINAKSIMGVMMLAAGQGTTLQLRIDGIDENEALVDIEKLINDRFGEGE
ncbi:MAG: HPr family phosphocarrier protein [Gammaproteobacteria bacterium]|nr:HPr family phosphocarrier protein [Gammaproteobacteria bacterium]